MSKFCKVFINPGAGIAVVEATRFTQTDKMVKDIGWESRIGWRYEPNQVRKCELLQFKLGIWSESTAGAVYCFEEDVEKAKEVLINAVNSRLEGLVNMFKREMQHHAESIVGIPGANVVSSTVIEITKQEA